MTLKVKSSFLQPISFFFLLKKWCRQVQVNFWCTSAVRAFGPGYFHHSALVLDPRHIGTRPKVWSRLQRNQSHRDFFCFAHQPPFTHQPPCPSTSSPTRSPPTSSSGPPTTPASTPASSGSPRSTAPASPLPPSCASAPAPRPYPCVPESPSSSSPFCSPRSPLAAFCTTSPRSSCPLSRPPHPRRTCPFTHPTMADSPHQASATQPPQQIHSSPRLEQICTSLSRAAASQQQNLHWRTKTANHHCCSFIASLHAWARNRSAATKQICTTLTERRKFWVGVEKMNRCKVCEFGTLNKVYGLGSINDWGIKSYRLRSYSTRGQSLRCQWQFQNFGEHWRVIGLGWVVTEV